MRSDRIVAVALLAVFALYASQIPAIPLDAWATDSFLTPRTLPTVLSVFGVGLALALLAWPESAHRMVRLSRAQRTRLGLLVLSLAAFAALVKYLGLWIACGVFLLATQFIEGERRPLRMLALAVACPAVLWLLVVIALQQDVASGALF